MKILTSKTFLRSISQISVLLGLALLLSQSLTAQPTGKKIIADWPLLQQVDQLENQSSMFDCVEDQTVCTQTAFVGEKVVSNFCLPLGETLLLESDLILYSYGDVEINGDILGKAITQSNDDGQHLVIRSNTRIILR